MGSRTLLLTSLVEAAARLDVDIEQAVQKRFVWQSKAEPIVKQRTHLGLENAVANATSTAALATTTSPPHGTYYTLLKHRLHTINAIKLFSQFRDLSSDFLSSGAGFYVFYG